MKRLAIALAVVAALIAAPAYASNVRPPKLYPFHAYEGAVALDCVQVNGAGLYYCHGAYVAPLTDARVVSSFSGGATVTYYHQAVSCQPSTSYYGPLACEWSLG